MPTGQRRTVKLTDWAAIARYHRRAEELATALEPRLRRGEALHWDELKGQCKQDLTLWKLLLKTLRGRAYHIGRKDDPYVRA